MESDEVEHDALRLNAMDPRLATIRLHAAVAASGELRKAGLQLHLVGHLIGDGRISGSSPRGNGDDAQVAVGVLAQIAADLLEASAALLSGSNHYAGAALLRQIVEVEYLTWAFANDKREASGWLNSTHQERLDFFAPGKLRGISDGHFLASDYRHHCEHGGHPVPMAIPLLGNPESPVSQMLLVDLPLHSWRTTDNLIAWTGRFPPLESVSEALSNGQHAFARWGETDPLYKWSLTAPPAPLP
ncbi:MAG: hypothetical protein ACK4V6_00565 [Microthrixaceae bacterium]